MIWFGGSTNISMGLADGFTKKYGIHRLVYFEQYSDIEAAILREKQLKKWIAPGDSLLRVNPNWDDLYRHCSLDALR